MYNLASLYDTLMVVGQHFRRPIGSLQAKSLGLLCPFASVPSLQRKWPSLRHLICRRRLTLTRRDHLNWRGRRAGCLDSTVRMDSGSSGLRGNGNDDLVATVKTRNLGYDPDLVLRCTRHTAGVDGDSCKVNG